MKRLLILVMALSMMVFGTGIASAQGPRDGQNRPNRPGVPGGIIREMIEAVANETGLPVSDILAQMAPGGATLADVIQANGGSVDNVVNAVVATTTERVNQAIAENKLTQEQGDRILSNLPQLVTDGINGDLPLSGDRQGIRSIRGALVEAMTSATGLDAQMIWQQVRDGSTGAEIIEANGGSVDAVVADATANATELINSWVEAGRITQEQADDMISNLSNVFTEILNGTFERPRLERPGRAVMGVLRAMSDATGLPVNEIVPLLRDGQSPAQILSDNGVDVTVFIDDHMAKVQERLDDAVANGRLTQEQADERLETIRTTLTDRLNNPINPPVPVPPETETGS